MLINDILKQKNKTIWINKYMPGVEFTQSDVNKMIRDNLKVDSLETTQGWVDRFEIKKTNRSNYEQEI